MKGISFIIPTSLQSDEIYKNISKINAFTDIKYKFEIIVIINNTNKKFNSFFSNDVPLNVIYSNKAGAALSRNIGAENAVYDILIFMDDDILPIDRHSWNKFIELILSNNGEMIYLPKWKYSDDLMNFCCQSAMGRFLVQNKFNCIEGYLNKKLPNNQIYIPHDAIASYFFPIQKTLFIKLGGYDNSIPYAGFEDYIISQKIKQIGIPVFIYNEYVVYHDEWQKININNWLNAKERNAQTRKAAVNNGYKELEIKYSWMKKILFKIIVNMKGENLILLVYKCFSVNKKMDFISFYLIKIMLAIRIYQGYTKKNI